MKLGHRSRRVARPQPAAALAHGAAVRHQLSQRRIGSAPAGASGQAATSPRGADGAPLLSGQAVRDPGFPRGGGAPVPGLLVIEFRLGSAPGAYQPTFELIGGNRVQFTLRAAPPTE